MHGERRRAVVGVARLVALALAARLADEPAEARRDAEDHEVEVEIRRLVALPAPRLGIARAGKR